MKQKNTKELDDILGKTHISDFDKFCVEQKGSMDPEQNAFSEYIKDLLKEKKILITHGGGFHWETPDHFRIVYLPCIDDLKISMDAMKDFLATYKQR